MRQKIKEYYDSTKFNFSQQDEQLDESEWPLAWKKIFYKTYPRFPSKKLEVTNQESHGLVSLLMGRKSTRKFSKAHLEFQTMSDLLYYSAGVKPGEDIDFAKRMYPSAGARYPVELYFVANRIANLNNGLYHYAVKLNEIETLLSKDLSDEMKCIINTDLYKAHLIMVLTGELSRTEVKYGSNAYRFALIEAGHIGQNISLLSEKYGLGCCAIGGFDNDLLVKLLDLGDEELPLYMLAVGCKNG